MKKNLFSDKKSGGSTKGFYAALGISVLMIGSACFFAYNESKDISEDKLSAKNDLIVSDEAVDKKYTDIPKVTAPAVVSYETVTTVVTAERIPETTPAATLPASAISVAEAPSQTDAAPETPPQEKSASLENIVAPLSDISSVITAFSGTELVKNETTGSWQTHNGTDYAAQVGSEVYVISPGEVSAVNDDPLWGTVVIVDHHNGYISRYCGLSKELSVQIGDTLASGDILGLVGDTADIESGIEPHLHIEVTHNGKYIDPAALFE